MSRDVPTALSDITPAWLGDALDLPISALELDVKPRWNVADFAFASATVEGVSDPVKLFLKLRADPDPLRDVLPGEWRFFSRDKLGGLPIPAPRLVLADPDTGRSLLIQDDLTHSHMTLSGTDPPNVEDACRAVASLARCHAAFARRWSSLSDRDQAAWRASQTALFEVIKPDVPAFLEALAAIRPGWDISTLEAALDGGLRRRLAFAEEADAWLTIAQGDFHPWNVLYPRNGRDPAIILDWEYHSLNFPGTDLSNLLWRFVPPSWRDAHAGTVLAAYNDALGDDDLRLDHEALMIGHLGNAEIPVHLWRETVPLERWIHELGNWIDAAKR